MFLSWSKKQEITEILERILETVLNFVVITGICFQSVFFVLFLVLMKMQNTV